MSDSTELREKATEISELGEFGLIDRLTEGLEIKNRTTLRGVGDDCAVLEYKDSEVLVSTDLLVEGIHFDLTYVPLKHLGYKSAVVNFSDIYAMNGRPQQIVVSLAISKRFTVEHIEELYAGLRLACVLYGVDLVGGDTTTSRSGLVISITVIGSGEKDRIVYRDGARDTDLICVTGDLGSAYMGLQLLEREKVASAAARFRRQGVSDRASAKAGGAPRCNRGSCQGRHSAYGDDGYFRRSVVGAAAYLQGQPYGLPCV